MATPAISTPKVFTHEATFRKDPFGVLHIRHDGHGNVEINLEDAVHGLGFIHTQNKGGKTYSNIRWDRVKEYLEEFGYEGEVNKDAYIPESTFFKLTMKASNKAARDFQHWILREVLPNIRLHYCDAPSTASVTPESVLDTDLLIRFAIELEVLRTKKAELEMKIDEQAQQLKKYEGIVEPLVTLSNAIAAFDKPAVVFQSIAQKGAK